MSICKSFDKSLKFLTYFCLLSLHVTFSCIAFYLIIDQQLHGVAAPLDEHQLIGLSRYCVGEGSTEAGTGTCFQPQADCQGEDLVDHRPLHSAVHVVGPHGEVEQEGSGTL